MGKLYPSVETLKLAKRVRKGWKSGRYKTYASLAKAFGITPGQARGIARNEMLVGGLPWPDGNWKQIQLYGKDYIVYDDGRVWSVISNKFIGSENPLGYKLIGVVNDQGKNENYRVSRLMLEAFVRPPKQGEFARHLDDNPRNNKLKNLAWGLPQRNSQDMVRNCTQASGEKNGQAKLTEEVVREILSTYDGTGFKTYAKKYIKDKNLKVGMLAVVRILRRQSWSHISLLDLPDKAVRAIHRNFQKSAMPIHVFCVKFSAYLNQKGFSGVTPFHIRSALEGRLWKAIYDEYN